MRDCGLELDSLHNIERPPGDESVNHLFPVGVQPEPGHTRGEETKDRHCRATELRRQSVKQRRKDLTFYPGTVDVRFNEAKVCQIQDMGVWQSNSLLA